MKTLTSLAILVAAINGADAFFRMPCRGRLGIARIDPLVSPGEVAQHAHSIHGSSGKLRFPQRHLTQHSLSPRPAC